MSTIQLTCLLGLVYYYKTIFKLIFQFSGLKEDVINKDAVLKKDSEKVETI